MILGSSCPAMLLKANRLFNTSNSQVTNCVTWQIWLTQNGQKHCHGEPLTLFLSSTGTQFQLVNTLLSLYFLKRESNNQIQIQTWFLRKLNLIPSLHQSCNLISLRRKLFLKSNHSKQKKSKELSWKLKRYHQSWLFQKYSKEKRRSLGSWRSCRLNVCSKCLAGSSVTLASDTERLSRQQII